VTAEQMGAGTDRRGLTLAGIGVRIDGVDLVRDVTLAVAAGEWVSLVGPNGAGKSTLLRAAAGLVEATGGVRIGGVDARTLSRRAWARTIAYVPQRPVLPPGLSVADYVLLGRTPHLGFIGHLGRHDEAVVAEVLSRLDLTALASRRLGTLSGGEAQRAVLGRALAQEAGVLLLDEPTTGLDVGHQQQVLELVDTVRREGGLTVVSAMHDLTLASQYSDRTALLAAGALVAVGPAALVLTAARITEHYDARVVVTAAPDGSVIVVPSRRAAVTARAD